MDLTASPRERVRSKSVRVHAAGHESNVGVLYRAMDRSKKTRVESKAASHGGSSRKAQAKSAPRPTTSHLLEALADLKRVLVAEPHLAVRGTRGTRAEAVHDVPQRPAYRSDQLLVTLDPHAVTPLASTALRAVARLEESVRSPFAALEREGLIEEVTAIGQPSRRAEVATGAMRAAASLVASVDPQLDASLAGLSLVRLAPRASIAEVRRRLDTIPAVQDVERVPYRTVAPPSRPRPLTSGGGAAREPWNLGAIRWSAPPEAGNAIKVAVLDTGVDEGHPDLVIAGYNHGDVSGEDIVGHGTHVCGIVAGRRSADGAFAGGVSNAALHVWKIFDDQPNEYGDYLVDEVLYLRALIAALQEGCKVLNLSIGGTGTTSRERTIFARLVTGGVTIVGAMGNEYEQGNPLEYPAAHADVIAVGAVGPDLVRAPFSNTGNHIALVAPGVDIVSSLPRAPSAARRETMYASWAGTSMATPHVAGAAARLLAVNPGLSPVQIKISLQASARKLPGMDARAWTRLYGSGLLQL